MHCTTLIFVSFCLWDEKCRCTQNETLAPNSFNRFVCYCRAKARPQSNTWCLNSSRLLSCVLVFLTRSTYQKLIHLRRGRLNQNDQFIFYLQLTTQGTGHLPRLHDLASVKLGQSLPPCAGCLVTERDLVCVPPPHVTEQDSQLLHPETFKELEKY